MSAMLYQMCATLPFKQSDFARHAVEAEEGSEKIKTSNPSSRMIMKKILALTGLIVACSLPFAAQSLECSVKPKVLRLKLRTAICS